jgi:hypothetical protein
MKSQFTVVNNKGFQMKFKNGNTISVMFGAGNYCSNRQAKSTDEIENSKTAEIRIWHNAANYPQEESVYMFDTTNDEVKGWCSTDEVAEWIDFAANNNF